MSILSDKSIRALCADTAPNGGMIKPFHPESIREVVDTRPAERAAYELAEWARANPTQVPSQELLTDIAIRHPDVLRKITSKGLTSYGYDVSLSEDRVQIFTNINSAVINPKRFDGQRCLADATIHTDDEGGKYVIIPPNSYMLGVTCEYFRIPRDILVICLGKSTYARCGAIVNATPAEPEFEGQVVIEISNSTSLPMMIYLNEGIAQFLFLKGDEPCEVSYADRGGKYMGQTGVTLPKV